MFFNLFFKTETKKTHFENSRTKHSYYSNSRTKKEISPIKNIISKHITKGEKMVFISSIFNLKECL